MLREKIERLGTALADKIEYRGIIVDNLFNRWTGQTQIPKQLALLRRKELNLDDELFDELQDISLGFQDSIIQDERFIRLHWAFFSLHHFHQFDSAGQTIDWFNVVPDDWELLNDWWVSKGSPEPIHRVPPFECLRTQCPSIRQIVDQWGSYILDFCGVVCSKPHYQYLLDVYETCESLENRVLYDVSVKIMWWHWKPQEEIAKLVRMNVANIICDIARFNAADSRTKHTITRTPVCSGCGGSLEHIRFEDGCSCPTCGGRILSSAKVRHIGNSTICLGCNSPLSGKLTNRCKSCNLQLTDKVFIDVLAKFTLRTKTIDDVSTSDEKGSTRRSLVTVDDDFERDMALMFDRSSSEFALIRDVLNSGTKLGPKDVSRMAKNLGVDINSIKGKLMGYKRS